MKYVVNKRAVLDCVGFDLLEKGELAVRFALASFTESGDYLDDGSRPATPSPVAPVRNVHRFTLQPGDDIDAMVAAITPHLAQMGYDPPSAADVQKLKAIALACWTPEAVAEHTKRWVAWERENEIYCRQIGIEPMTMEQGRWFDFAQRLDQSARDMQGMPLLQSTALMMRN